MLIREETITSYGYIIIIILLMMATPSLVLYGHAWNRASRCMWMLRELNLPYKLKEVDLLSLKHDHLNPNRKQPYLHDSQAGALFESMAINMHLVEEYGTGCEITPRSASERAALRKWSVWAATELDMLLFEGVFYRKAANRHPLSRKENYLNYFDREKTQARFERIKREVSFPLEVLDKALLAEGGWLIGGRFTAADLNVASVCQWALLIFGRKHLAQKFPNLASWLMKCFSRAKSPLQQAPKQISEKSFSHEGFVNRMDRNGSLSTTSSSRL